MSKRVLVLVNHPVGGIRSYLGYVYGHSTFNDTTFELLLRADQSDARTFQGILSITNVSIITTGYGLRFLLAALRRILFGHYDLVHSHGLTSGVIAALPAWLRRRKHIVTLHDVFADAQFSGLKGRLRLWLISASFRLVTVIQPVSDGCRDNLLNYFPQLRYRNQAVVTIRNGIDVAKFAEAPRIDMHDMLSIDRRIKIFGFLGRFMRQKGFEYLVDAVAQLRVSNRVLDQYVIVAIGSGNYVSESRKEVQERRLDSCFYFLPFINDIASIIASLDAIIMPSLWEAHPLLAMEGLIAGTPLIATNCIGLSEVISGSPSIVIPPRDANALADAIAMCCANDLRQAFDEFRKQASKEFDVEKTANALRKLYNSLIDGSLLTH